MTASKIVAAAASTAGGSALDIDNVFKTTVYKGTGSAQTITNGIDYSGTGGLCWIKKRNNATNGDHALFDTVRGVTKRIRSNTTDQEYSPSDSLTAFNNNGFSIGSDVNINTNNDRYVAWNFLKTEKFFDIVQYTGNGSARTIAHNLGSAPGMILVKRTTGTQNWTVYHKFSDASSPQAYYSRLNDTIKFVNDTNMWNNTAPTSTVFSVGTDSDNNTNGETYIAYLFAHNDGDGIFGPDEDQDIIKCGSYQSTGTRFEVNVGFEPQWLLVKRVSEDTEGNQDYHSWAIQDEIRGIGVAPYNQSAFAHSHILWANGDAGEGLRGDLGGNGNTDIQWMATPTGFSLPDSSKVECNRTGNYRYIWVAIRRGKIAPPESASDVFDVDRAYAGDDNTPQFSSTFKVDFAIDRYNRDTTNDTKITSRLTGTATIATNNTNAEGGDSQYDWAFNTGYRNGSGADPNWYAWMWQRAPKFCDVACWIGTGSGRTISHSLQTAPEMMWVRKRNATEDFTVYHAAKGSGFYLELNSTTTAQSASSAMWNSTSPTSSVFSVGTHGRTNGSGGNYIGYLFSSLAGVSKVGSYTGDGQTGKQIDCGFTNGARFVLIKDTTNAGHWYLWDSERGIIAGNDPYLLLNDTDAENSNGDNVDPYSAGFIVNGPANNVNGSTHIFYAIAA